MSHERLRTALFPDCFCPNCQRLCACLGGSWNGTLLFCYGLPDVRAVLTGTTDGSCVDDCDEVNGTYDFVLSDVLTSGCFAAQGTYDLFEVFTCHNRHVTVDLRYADCGPDSSITVAYGATGGFGATWQLSGGEAVDAFWNVLCQGGTVSLPLTDTNDVCDAGDCFLSFI